MKPRSDISGLNVREADLEDCVQTYSDGFNDITCTASCGFVCEYDVYGTGFVSSNSTAFGVVLRGSYIEVGFNTNGSIGIK